jgi:hypothetical protein
VGRQDTTGRLIHPRSSGGRVHRAQGGKGPSLKAWKPNRLKRKMVLGGDIGLEESCNLALCALVGHLSYRTLCRQSLPDWVSSTWAPMLGYTPEVLTLSRGWFGFIFKSPEDTLVVLDKLWVIDGNNLMLKCWRVCFDPVTEYFQFLHLWVLLPGLPLQLWNAKALEAIGNELGRFIKVDEATIKAPDKRIRKVLVEIDIHKWIIGGY